MVGNQFPCVWANPEALNDFEYAGFAAYSVRITSSKVMPAFGYAMLTKSAIKCYVTTVIITVHVNGRQLSL